MEDFISDETDQPYVPSTLTQSIMGATIMITIGLAFYGAAMILQEVHQTFMGLR